MLSDIREVRQAIGVDDEHVGPAAPAPLGGVDDEADGAAAERRRFLAALGDPLDDPAFPAERLDDDAVPLGVA